MVPYIYDIYKKCDTLWVACTCAWRREIKRERERVREKVSERERERMNAKKKKKGARERVCICDVYIVLRKKERELFQGTPCYYLPPIIPNNNSMFKMQHQKTKKKKNCRYHEIKYSVRKHEDVSLFRTFLVLRKGERHVESHLWTKFVKHCALFLVYAKFDCDMIKKQKK